MPKLRRVSGREAVRALEKLGFQQVRQRGSHVILKKNTLVHVGGSNTRVCRTICQFVLRTIYKIALQSVKLAFWVLNHAAISLFVPYSHPL